MRKTAGVALVAAALLGLGSTAGIAQTDPAKHSATTEASRGRSAGGAVVRAETDRLVRSPSPGRNDTNDSWGRGPETGAHRQITDQHGIVPGSVY